MPPETSSIDYKKGEETLDTQASLAPSLSKMDSKFWEKGSKDSWDQADLNAIKSSWKYGEKMNPTTGPLESKVAEGARLAVKSIEANLDDPSGVPIEADKKAEFLASTQKEIDLLEAQLIEVGSQKLSPQEFQKKITEVYTAAIERFSQIAAEANGLKNGPAGSLDAKGKDQLKAAQRGIVRAFDFPFRETLEHAQRAKGAEEARKARVIADWNEVKEPPVGSSDRNDSVYKETKGWFQAAFPGR